MKCHSSKSSNDNASATWTLREKIFGVRLEREGERERSQSSPCLIIGVRSGAAHQACSTVVADFPYRATPHDLSVDVRKVVLVVTT